MRTCLVWCASLANRSSARPSTSPTNTPTPFSRNSARRPRIAGGRSSRSRSWRTTAHLVVGVPGDPDPSDVLGDFKSYGSRPLNRRWGKPASGTWWTEGGSKRKKADDAATLQAIRYVRDQENPLVVWLNADAIFTFGERGTRHLGERSDRRARSNQGAYAPRSPGQLSVWHGGCIRVVRHGNPDGVAGYRRWLGRSEPSGVVPGGSLLFFASPHGPSARFDGANARLQSFGR